MQNTTTRLPYMQAQNFCDDLTTLCRKHGITLLCTEDQQFLLVPEATEGRMVYEAQWQRENGYTTFPTLATEGK